MKSKILIAIPARYHSSRLPGKPLLKLLGKEMLLRVYENVQKVKLTYPEGCVTIVVATEDQRIVDFCQENNIDVRITSDNCLTGTDRCQELLKLLPDSYDFVVNMQGDNPLCPPWFVKTLIDEFLKDPTCDVLTPCVQLDWKALDQLREHKKTTPFSGTTAIIHPETNNALWFSKNIIPAIRKEEKLRASGNVLSPIWRHIGLYGYKTSVLQEISTLQQSDYESDDLEGLEQLRFLLNGYTVRIAKVTYKGYEELGSSSGVDAHKDIKRTEALLEKYGEYTNFNS